MIHTLDDIEMKEILMSSQYAHLGCSESNEPYVVPISYAYNDGKLYCYTHAGRKISILQKNPRVCVQVGDQTNGQWRSVIIHGMYQELMNDERVKAVQILARRIHESSSTLPFLPDDLVPAEAQPEPIIYCINIREMTGRSFG